MLAFCLGITEITSLQDTPSGGALEFNLEE